MSLFLQPALPEIWLALAGLILPMIGVFRKADNFRLVSWLVVGALGIALFLLSGSPIGRTLAFNNLYVADGFTAFVKPLILIGSAATVMMTTRYAENENMARFELPVLLLFSTLGMLMMVSANSLLSLYIALELQSLPLYVAAAFRRDTLRSTEAGLKYFVLGALSSGLLLYGCSLIYGFTGSMGFEVIAQVMAENYRNFEGGAPIGQQMILLTGVILVISGIAFKVSAVPFHMWTPDVYEGAPTAVTAFLATAPKIAALALFARLLLEPFGPYIEQWQQVLWILSLASMIVGAVAALPQTNIKRLMAYSSIGQVGYALIGLVPGSQAGLTALLAYLCLYLLMTLGSFACILSMRRGGRMVEQISDLSGLSRSQPFLAAALAVFMFSLAGIPPLAGFFAKLYPFQAAIEGGFYSLAIIGVVASVIAAYYYLKIVKVMYFDEPLGGFDLPLGWVRGGILSVTALITLLYIFVPGPLLMWAQNAAAALFR